MSINSLIDQNERFNIVQEQDLERGDISELVSDKVALLREQFNRLGGRNTNGIHGDS